MSNNGCWFVDPFPLISISTKEALHGQQSAVHCLSSMCGGNSLRKAWFLHCCAFCICKFDHLSTVGFKARLGWRKIEMRHSRDGLGPGLWLPRGPLSKFGLSLRYWLGYRSFHLVKSGHMWKIPSQAQSLVSRACVMTGFGSKFCGQKCVL